MSANELKRVSLCGLENKSVPILYSKLVKFEWRAVWTFAKPHNLRRSNMKSFYSDKTTKKVIAADHILFAASDKCGIKIYQLGDRIRVFTSGCDAYSTVWNFDIIFQVNGSKCEYVSG